MGLLELEHISKRYEQGARRIEALRDISLEVYAGELVTVWGLRHSGRSTLLRLAAGIEAPDAGVVRFTGHDLACDGGALGAGIAYCVNTSRDARGLATIEELVTDALALGVTPPNARTRAWTALERTGARDCAKLRPHELGRSEAARVRIARAIASQPALLLIDEPTEGVDLLERDGILRLLRSLATDGIAVLTSVSESTGLFGADRALSLSAGEMYGHVSPELAPVVRLSRRAMA